MEEVQEEEARMGVEVIVGLVTVLPIAAVEEEGVTEEEVAMEEVMEEVVALEEVEVEVPFLFFVDVTIIFSEIFMFRWRRWRRRRSVGCKVKHYSLGSFSASCI